MNRTTAREIAVQILFIEKFGSVNLDDFLTEANFEALSQDCAFYTGKPECDQIPYIRKVVEAFRSHQEEVDAAISKYSKDRAINRISGTALAVLRCAITEILYVDDVPTAVAINSAVEIDKGYDEEETVAFVNGILGSFVRDRETQ